MKKLAFILLLNSVIGYAQSQYSIEQVEKSEDPQILANFIITNPSHPRISEIRQRLTDLMIKKNAPVQDSTKNKTGNQQSTPSNKSKQDQAVDILNHLLKDSPSKENSAYVLVKNLSLCPITVTFTGENTYTLDILPHSLGRLLVDKGTYNISSKICNAKFNANRDITHDFEMSLNNVTTTKKQ